MTVFTEGPHAGGFIVSEPDINLSREVGTIVSGSGIVQAGTVMALNSSTGKWAPVADAGSNNTNVAAGVLFALVNATSADAEGVIIRKLASVNAGELIWPAGVDVATGTGQLATAGIVVMNSAAAGVL